MDSKKDNKNFLLPSDASSIHVFQLFKKDTHLIFIYKKSEKIVSAFYLISNLMADAEPFKWQLREIGLGLISKVLAFANGPLSKEASLLWSDLVRVASLLEVAYLGGLVTEMNFSILKKELQNLLEALRAKNLSDTGIVGATHGIGADFFAVTPDDLMLGEKENTSGNTSQDRAYTWADAARLSESRKGHNMAADVLQEGISHKSAMVHQFSRPVANKRQQLTGTAQEREALVINLLKSRNNLTIKDFTPVVKGCSEKTIQRELLRLVKLGVLKREGERRWSRYSLCLPLKI